MGLFRIKKGFTVLLVLLLATTLLLTGCGAQNKSENSATSEAAPPSYDYDKGAPAEAEQKAGDGNVGFTQSEQVLPTKMMIYKGHIAMEVEDMNVAAKTISQIVNRADGYLINSDINENDYMHYGHYEYRIPASGFQGVIDEIEKLEFGKVSYQKVNGQDVTEEYFDLESRLKAKRIYESRLLEFLTKANKTEDLLKISYDLNRVQEEIEAMEGRMRYLKNHADFSTLTIDMEQYKNKAAATASTWQKSIEGFKRSIEQLVNMFTAFLIWFISSLPILFFIVLVGGVLWKVGIKKYLKKIIAKYKHDDNQNKE